MANLKKKFSYLGVDETSLGLSKKSLVVAVAETDNASLTNDLGYGVLMKAKDYLRAAKIYNTEKDTFDHSKKIDLPTLDEMFATGLKKFHWTRSRGGRFSRQLVEHASVAHVVTSNGYDPEKTVLFLDSFYGNADMSEFLLKEYFWARGFKINRKNIVLVPGGDKSVSIINYADILAFKIGLHLNEKYKKFHPEFMNFPFTPEEIPYDARRVVEPLGERERIRLEGVIDRWKSGKTYFKKK